MSSKCKKVFEKIKNNKIEKKSKNAKNQTEKKFASLNSAFDGSKTNQRA